MNDGDGALGFNPHIRIEFVADGFGLGRIPFIIVDLSHIVPGFLRSLAKIYPCCSQVLPQDSRAIHRRNRVAPQKRDDVVFEIMLMIIAGKL